MRAMPPDLSTVKTRWASALMLGGPIMGSLGAWLGTFKRRVGFW